MVDKTVAVNIKNECNFCSKKFTRKIYYDRHILVCELLCKTSKERKLDVEETEDIPTVRKLYNIIMEMSIKYKKLEEKVDELSKYVDTKKKKINIIEWLNITYKTTEPFQQWMTRIKVERKHLDYIFDKDYVYGAVELLREFIERGRESGRECERDSDREEEPLRCFEQKENIFYIVDTENKWTEMSYSQFDKMIDFISKQFLHEFVLWQNENKHRMEDDNYSILYMKNIKKINGGNNTTSEQLYRKIYRELYKELKKNINKINQYEVMI
jgi:hypothetical protein